MMLNALGIVKLFTLFNVLGLGFAFGEDLFGKSDMFGKSDLFSQFTSCPEVPSMKNLDLKRLQGWWYVAESEAVEMTQNCKCGMEHFAINLNTGVVEGSINAINTTRGINKEMTWSYKMRPTSDPRTGDYLLESSEFAAMLEEQIKMQMRVQLLDTDYDNYAIFFSCATIQSFAVKITAIETRDRHPSAKVLNMAHAALEKFNIDSSRMKKISQDGCTNGSSTISLPIFMMFLSLFATMLSYHVRE